MGYRTVAINQTIDESIFETEQKSNKKKKAQSTPVKIVPHDLFNLKEEFKNKLVILSRLTFLYSESAKTYLLAQCAGFKQFDIFAALPRGQAAFQFALAQLNADIITINSTCGYIKFSRKLYMQAIERGVHFEIRYVDLIIPKSRIIAIQNSHSFYVYGKSKVSYFDTIFILCNKNQLSLMFIIVRTLLSPVEPRIINLYGILMILSICILLNLLQNNC